MGRLFGRLFAAPRGARLAGATLRTRLIVATAAVLAVVLTALALFSARVTRIELLRLENVLVNERLRLSYGQ